MPPVGVPVGALLAVTTGPAEFEGATLAVVAIGAGVKAIGCELVIFGFATAGAPGGMTFTLTKGGLEFAQAKAWRLVSKNLSMTIALRS